MDFNVTAYVQAWAKGGVNEGLRLRAADEASNNNSWSKYRGTRYATGGERPRLIVTYNRAPNVPAAPAATGATAFTPAGSSTSTLYVPSTKPTFTTTVSDPDGGTVRGYFTVSTTAGGSSVSNCYSASPGVSSGSKASCAVGTALSEGGTYYVRASALDGRLYAGATVTNTAAHYSSDVKFTVDATAPTLTLTSSAFSNGSWLTSPPASNTFTLNGPSDVTSFAIVKDGVPSTVTANSTGDATITWTPTSGAHTLGATAIDRAGNRSDEESFSFGVGTAGIAAPADKARSTSTFPIAVSGPPGASSANLQWRLADDPDWVDATALKNGAATWSGSVTTTSAESTTPDGLHWDAADESTATGKLAAPALVEIRGCFQFASGPESCSPTRTVQLVPSAFGGNFPVTDLGPASVALFSGEATISAGDAADSRAGFGRTFSSYDAGTVTAGVFGPGWSDPQILAADPEASEAIVDNRTKDGSIVVVDVTNGTQAFVPDPTNAGTPGRFVPLEPTGDATVLTFTAVTGGADTLVLSRPLGSGATTTSWTLKAPDGGGNPSWVLDAVNAPGDSADVGVASTPGHPTFVRESEASAAATCNPTTQSEACRALKITYIGTGSDTRVASVIRVVGATTPAGVKEKTLATYTYGASNRLASVCGPAPSAQLPALCTSYDYATIGGRTVLAQVTPAGLKPWRFDYDTTGRLLTAKRERPTGGDSTWSVDYSLHVGDTGLPDLSAVTATQWGQTVAPTQVFAVYLPYAGAADVTKAQLYFTTADGTVTNTASYGPSSWQVDTNWYDANGSVIQKLDMTGWSRVQAAATADRPQVAADASSYTISNTWGEENTVGTRVVDEYGPAHTATLEDGTTGMFRTHTHTMYDDDPNVDAALITNWRGPTGLGLVVKETISASDAARTADYDTKVTKYGYDPIVTGDGNGWALGSPTTVSTQLDANTWSTQTTRFDASGQEVESRQPGGTADASGIGTDAHSTVTTYYTATGDGDCGGNPAWVGLVCKVGPPTQLAGQPISSSHINAYDDDLNPTSVKESSGGQLARTTTTSHDELGRVKAITKATTGSGVRNETIATSYGYDNATGLPTTVSSTGQTITTGFDTWGRTSSYTDALGTNSSTTYDAVGNIATFNDGAGTYAYTYDSHGILTSVDAGGGVGTFSYSYMPSGQIEAITYPNGMVASRDYDQIDNQTGLRYRQGTSEIMGFNATLSADGRTTAQASIASSQRFTFDNLGRLTKTEDTGEDACNTRTYAFDASSNRSGFTSYAPNTAGACQTATPAASKTNTYDPAGRITNSGYTYDTLGRTISTPQADAGPQGVGALTASFHADDMVASLGQSVTNPGGGTASAELTYMVDPARRLYSITTSTNGIESNRLRYRFAADMDSPTAVDSSSDGGGSWTSSRYVIVPGVGLAASSTGGDIAMQLSNPHGDIVGTMPGNVGSSTLDFFAETDEFGNAEDSMNTPRFGWLGSHERAHDTLGGLVLMGARLYNPSTGLFASSDSVQGGGATAYAYPEDPVNQLDLNGLWWWHKNNYVTSGGMTIKQAKEFIKIMRTGGKTWRVVVNLIGLFTGGTVTHALFRSGLVKFLIGKVAGFASAITGLASGRFAMAYPGEFCLRLADSLEKHLPTRDIGARMYFRVGVKQDNWRFGIDRFWLGTQAWYGSSWVHLN